MMNSSFLLLAVVFLFCFQGIIATGRATVTKEQRKLQTLYSHNLEVAAVYGFAFNGSTPELSLTADDMDDVLRFTEIFYRRNLGASFSLTYQDVALTYQAHNWDPSENMLELDFDVTATFRVTGNLPTGDEVWDVIANVAEEVHIRHAASLAEPQELFQWTNSTEIRARVKNSGTFNPTSAPVSALILPLTEPPTTSTTQNLVQPVAALVEPATEPPTTSTTQNHQDPAPTSTSGFFNFPTRAPQQQREPNPTDSTPTTVAAQDQKTGPTLDEKQEIPQPVDIGITAGVQSNEAGGTIDLTSAQQKEAEEEPWVSKELAEQLTAANMFYWMAAVRVMYFAAAFVLQKWSYAYRRSPKKFHLDSYWLQFVLYLPLLGVLTWALVSIQNDDRNIVKNGLCLFAHAAMLLLSLYGMEIFLRSMDNTLMAQRLIFMATLLYVIDFHDTGLHNPIDQVTFGAMEAVGACSELAAQWSLIHYRSWSDASPHEKETMRPGVTLTLRICLMCSFLSKVIFVASSIVWYALRFDCLAGSNLVFLVPLVRVVQAPTLVRSFFVQSQLYSRVANTDPPAVVNVKELEHHDDSTEEGSEIQEPDV